jgi:hypothetical protein
MTNGDGLLQAALNGDRDHPAAPHTPDELAAEARGGAGEACTKVQAENRPLARCIEPSLTPP